MHSYPHIYGRVLSKRGRTACECKAACHGRGQTAGVAYPQLARRPAVRYAQRSFSESALLTRSSAALAAEAVGAAAASLSPLLQGSGNGTNGGSIPTLSGGGDIDGKLATFIEQGDPLGLSEGVEGPFVGEVTRPSDVATPPTPPSVTPAPLPHRHCLVRSRSSPGLSWLWLVRAGGEKVGIDVDRMAFASSAEVERTDERTWSRLLGLGLQSIHGHSSPTFREPAPFSTWGGDDVSSLMTTAAGAVGNVRLACNATDAKHSLMGDAQIDGQHRDTRMAG